MASIALSPILDASAAEGLKTDILARRGEPLDLDGSLVQRLGGLCLQVLASARRTWAEDGQEFRIVDPTPALAEALRRFGAAAYLEEAA